LAIVLLLVGCTSNVSPDLKGSYQSDRDGSGYFVQMAFQPDENSFVQYIDNREVDKGVYGETESHAYKIKSDKQDFEIRLTTEDTFEIIIDQLNNRNPITMKNVSDVPTYFSTQFGDEEAYRALLEEK
ncbi:hypothetical protein J4G37_51215, partial [Microvirga sp. 3-52]|nr:hypothetical protein [Microvirga sp. 3-52]